MTRTQQAEGVFRALRWRIKLSYVRGSRNVTKKGSRKKRAPDWNNLTSALHHYKTRLIYCRLFRRHVGKQDLASALAFCSWNSRFAAAAAEGQNSLKLAVAWDDKSQSRVAITRETIASLKLRMRKVESSSGRNERTKESSSSCNQKTDRSRSIRWEVLIQQVSLFFPNSGTTRVAAAAEVRTLAACKTLKKLDDKKRRNTIRCHARVRLAAAAALAKIGVILFIHALLPFHRQCLFQRNISARHECQDQSNVIQ